MADQPGTFEVLALEIGRAIAAAASRLGDDAVLDTFAEFGVQFPPELLADAGVTAARGAINRVYLWSVEGDRLGPLEPPSLLVTEPPDHTRYRKLVSRVFSVCSIPFTMSASRSDHARPVPIFVKKRPIAPGALTISKDSTTSVPPSDGSKRMLSLPLPGMRMSVARY